MNKKIRVGVIGCGNCFSGLFQGIELYRTKLEGEKPVGIMHETLGGYSIFDIDFVAIWDVGENKIGKPLTEAIYEEPNMVEWVERGNRDKSNWWHFHRQVVVQEGPALDGIGIYVQNKIRPIVSGKSPSDLMNEIGKTIREQRVDVLVNYLPVGSQKATEWWGNVALGWGCAFVNCMPVFIASNEEWGKRFEGAKLPIIGDDVKGQVGATIVHRVLAKLVNDRGIKLENTYQLNVGGNTDFLNMKEQERLESKRISKTDAVQSQLEKELNADHIHIGPSDYLPQLGNTKVAYIRLEGKSFAGQAFSVETRLQVDDKSQSAGVVIDALRLAKIALDRKECGAIPQASAFLFKHPPIQYSDSDAKKLLEDYVKND
jgi:myo-inositol-1-phosphate synthase